MRIYTQKTRQDRTCGKCGETIKKGTEYRQASAGFRGPRMVRCMKYQCRFRNSELTTSKLSQAWAAIETAEDGLPDVESVDEITELFNDAAAELRDVAQEYRDASEAWAGGQGREEWDEAADNLDTAADELENHEPNEWDPETMESREDWLDDIRQEAEDLLARLDIG